MRSIGLIFLVLVNNTMLLVTMLIRRNHVIMRLLFMLADVLTQVVGTSPGFRSPVNDDSWHTVYFRRQVNTFQLTVDDRETSPVTGQSRLK